MHENKNLFQRLETFNFSSFSDVHVDTIHKCFWSLLSSLLMMEIIYKTKQNEPNKKPANLKMIASRSIEILNNFMVDTLW